MARAPVPITQGRDFYVPAFKVEVSGKNLPRQVILDITTVTYKDSLEQVDNFNITVNNWDAENLTFKFSDEHLFDPGQQVKLWMGYFGPDPLFLMTVGKINSLQPTFPAAGQPTLAVGGLGFVHDLRKKQESQPYIDRKDSQIAKEVASRWNVPIRTDAEAEAREQPNKYILQNNQYGYNFLHDRARKLGYDLVVESDGAGGQRLYFGPSEKIKRPTYELKYGLSLNEFQPHLEIGRQAKKVTYHGWDNVNKKKISVSVSRDELDTKSTGGADGQSGLDQAYSQNEEVISDHPVSSEAEARALCYDRMDRISKDIITGHGSVVGLPDLRAGSVVFLTGLGTRFSGRYLVTSTTHTIGDGGYTTQFECRREEV